MSGWISVSDWRRFQHYDPSKRQPPWIKTYTDLLHDDGYLSLSAAERSVLHGIWLVYASSRCRAKFEPRSLSHRLSMRVRQEHLDALVQAGFITEVASATLAEGYHDASPRARASEVEVEKEVNTPPTPPQGGNGFHPERISVKGYTGCRIVRGEFGMSVKYDPLGKDRPPSDWPHDKPTRDEIRNALKERQAVA